MAQKDAEGVQAKGRKAQAQAKGRKGVSELTKRTLVQLAVVAVVCLGLALPTGLGTPSSFGWDAIATICPLGWLQSVVTGRAVDPKGVVCFLATAALVLVFGRAFCGWFCPTPLVRRVFGGKKAMTADRSPRKDRCAQGCTSCEHACAAGKAVVDMEKAVASDGAGKGGGATGAASSEGRAKARFRVKSSGLDVRHAVLVGVLAASALLAFPVFCLVCPVGLSIGEVIAVWRLVQYNDLSWSLVVFPAVVWFELAVLPRWCHVVCPMSALVSLLSKANRTFRPVVTAGTCLRETGKAPCHKCFEACPEAIDLHDLAAGAPANECMKCHECAQACPTDSIRFPLLETRPMREGTLVVIGPSEKAPAVQS